MAKNSKANKSTNKVGSKGKSSNYKNKYSGNKKSQEEVILKEGAETPKVDSGRYDDIRSNDISWWNNSPMYPDATRVPFNRIYGNPITFPDLDETGASVLGDSKSVPGIMSIYYYPTVGGTRGGSNSPINRAFTSLYGAIYAKTTGAMQFQQADLAMFMTSFSSIACLIAHAKRILGVSQLYSGRNYYYPMALLQALGVEPEEVIGKQDALRMRLNNSILSFNNLKIPDFMSIYKRQYALAHNIYADEDDIESSIYAFIPAGYYNYIDTPINGNTSMLQYLDLGKGMETLLSAIETSLSLWRNSSDLGLISGSIQRAFSENSLITLDYVMSGDTIIPTVDRNIGWQINNCLAVGPVKDLDVTQNPVTNTLVFEPALDKPSNITQYYLSRGQYYLNSSDGDISDEFIMEATRLMPCLEGFGQPFAFCNTEIVRGFRITYAQQEIGRAHV